jgi:ATP phosphoribosyltransferase regulatory subunit
VGTRDLVPPEAAARRALVRRVAEVFELHGYMLVTTPPFERAEIVDRGLGATDPRETLRFLDPETGDVSVFRPDLTLQVARVVATRLADRPGPHRLFYEGHVIRARRGRARRQRQIAQIGAECVGIAGPTGDAEIVAMASRALDAVGLSHHIELAIVPLGRALTAPLAPEVRVEVTEALGHKDARAIERALGGTGAAARRRALVALPGLTGDVSVLREASRALRGVSAEPHLARLRSLHDELAARGLASRLRYDLGEVRGFDYYTGPSFSLLAEGPGEPLGGGGRYDDLVGRFGRAAPATGFAIDVDHLAWAISAQGGASRERARTRLCIAARRGPHDAIVDALRRADVAAAFLPGATFAEAIAYADAWSLDGAVELRGGGRAAIRWVGEPSTHVCGAAELPRIVGERRPSKEHES